MRFRDATLSLAVVILLHACGAAGPHVPASDRAALELVEANEPTPANDPWTHVRFDAQPAPAFGARPTAIADVNGDVAVGGLVVASRSARFAFPKATDVPILGGIHLGQSTAILGTRGTVFLARAEHAPLEALPIGGERFGALRAFARSADDTFYSATRSGLAYRLRESGATRVAADYTVVHVDRLSGGHGVEATVAPGLVLRIGDDGTETLVGRRPGVPASMAMVGGIALPEMPLPAIEQGELAEVGVAETDRAYAAAVHALGYHALAGGVVSPLDVVGLEYSVVAAAVRWRYPEHRVFRDGSVSIVDHTLRAIDAVGRIRSTIEVFSPERVLLSSRFDRFIAVGCELDSRRPAHEFETACLYDAGVRTELPWWRFKARAVSPDARRDEEGDRDALGEEDESGAEHRSVLASFFLGDALAYVVHDDAALALVRMTTAGEVLARDMLPIAYGRTTTVIASSTASGDSVFVRTQTDPEPGHVDAMVRIDRDGSVHPLPLPARVYQTAFADAQHGIATTFRSDRLALATADGGATWRPIGTGTSRGAPEPSCSPVACIAGPDVVARADVAARLRPPPLVRAFVSPMHDRLERADYVFSDHAYDSLRDEALAAVPRVSLPRLFAGRELPVVDPRARWSVQDFDRLRIRTSEAGDRIEATLFTLDAHGDPVTRREQTGRMPSPAETDRLHLVAVERDALVLDSYEASYRLGATSTMRAFGAPWIRGHYDPPVRLGTRTFALAEPRDGVLRFAWLDEGATRGEEGSIYVGSAAAVLGREWDERGVDAWPAMLDDEPGVLTRRGARGPVEFHGLRGSRRVFREPLPFAGWCAAEATRAGSIVVRSEGLLGPLAGVSADEVTRPGMRTWELDASGGCLRRIDWALEFDAHAAGFGTARLERRFEGESARFALRYAWHETLLELPLTSPDPRAADIQLGARADCGYPLEAGGCAEDTVAMPGGLSLAADESIALTSIREDDAALLDERERELPEWIEERSRMCSCDGCGETYRVGRPNTDGGVVLGARVGDEGPEIAWSGTVEHGLFAAAGGARVTFAAIEDGRAVELPPLQLTACPAHVLAVDAASRSVLVTDCPIDESGVFVRLMRLEAGRWVDTLAPLDTERFDAFRTRGAFVGTDALVFVGRGRSGVAFRLSRTPTPTWVEAQFRWLAAPP